LTASFADRLADAVRSKNSTLVVGLDPQLARIPDALRAAAQGDDPRARAADAIRRFNAGVIEQVAPYAAAVKPQIAFYEIFGPAGLAAYEDAITRAHEAGLLVIGDIKRGDIGSTAAAYARAHLCAADEDGTTRPAADAVTINPYLGTDSVKPFVDTARTEGAGLFVLVRTSNPSAAELQDLQADGRSLHDHVAGLVTRWGSDLVGDCGYSSVGAVVGATAPAELARLRTVLPQAWFLVPGVGAQGATAADVAPAFGRDGLGAVVNSSRGILYAFGSSDTVDWQAPVADAARQLRDQLRQAALQAAT
jgi:orotidine-5'-phosphate decarboxylase